MHGGQQPALLVGSPMCTVFSQIQAIIAARRDPQVAARERVRAMVHFRFVCQLYQMQINAGRYFLHEHPAGATSWKEECVENVWRQPSVERIVNDQCQFGQQYDDEPVMKPTGWMSNSLHSYSRSIEGVLAREGCAPLLARLTAMH